MASRVAEVIYRLKDLFSGPADKIRKGYDDIRRGSRRTADSVETQTGRMRNAFGTLGTAVGAAGKAFIAAFATRQVVSGVRGLADELDRLGKTADRLDIDPQALSGLEFAAERSGVSISKVTASIETLQKRTGEALQGLGRARIAFDALGIEAEQFARLGAAEQFELLADALQGVADAEERAAIAAELFSKGNIEVLNLLNQGSNAIREYVEQSQRLNPVTREATQAAADFNDALTNLNASLSGIGRQAVTPIIKELNQLIGATGNSASEFAQLRANAEEARRVLEAWENTQADLNPEALQEARENYAKAAKAVEDYTRQQEEAAEANRRAAEENAAAREAQRIADEEYQESLDDLTDSFREQAREQKQSLDQQRRELRTARAEMTRIESEFGDLVNEVVNPDIEDVGLGDVFSRINRGAAAAERGEADEAIRLAREGGDLLRRLKDEGTETEGTLKFLAESLRNVARTAQQQKVDVEIIDVEQAEAAFEQINAKLENLKSDAAVKGTEIGQALVNAIQAEINGASLGLPSVVLSGINDYRRSLETEGAK